jgi:hypothetical protein
MTKADTKELRDSYRFPGFTPSRFVGAHPDDPRGVVIEMSRRQKGGDAGPAASGGVVIRSVEPWCGTWTAGDGTSTSGSR